LKQDDQKSTSFNLIRLKHTSNKSEEETKKQKEVHQIIQTQCEMIMNINLASSTNGSAHTTNEIQASNDLFRSKNSNQHEQEQDMDLENETTSSTIFLINNSPTTINQPDVFGLNQDNQAYNDNQSDQSPDLDVIGNG